MKLETYRPIVRHANGVAILRVYGDPAPKGSKSVWRGRVVDDARGHVAWRDAVADVADEWVLRRFPRLDGPLIAEAGFYLRRPARTKYRELPIGPPDLSKLIRAVEDPLNGKVIADDARIISWTRTRKLWAGSTSASAPGVLLEVSRYSL